jgi:hypothetical protein
MAHLATTMTAQKVDPIIRDKKRRLLQAQTLYAKAKTRRKAKANRLATEQARRYLQSKAKRLLQDWANFEDPWAGQGREERDQDPPATERLAWLIRRHPDVFDDFVWYQALLRNLFCDVRSYLRFAWKETDPARRQWWLFEARQNHAIACDAGDRKVPIPKAAYKLMDPVSTPEEYFKQVIQLASGPPDGTVFNEVMVCVQKKLARAMRVCKNPDCPAPYFFKTANANTYCQPVCAATGLAASKSRYEARSRPAKGLRHTPPSR